MGENILIPSLVGGIPSVLIIFTIIRSYVNTSKIDNFCERMDKQDERIESLEKKQSAEINRVYDHCEGRMTHCTGLRSEITKRLNGLFGPAGR